MGSMTMVSRVLGLVRDIMLARLFGAGAGADAFFVAFKIPNFLRRLFAEGAFAQSFVPVLAEYKTQRDQQAVQVLIANVAGTLGVVLLAITGLAMLAAPLLIGLFAPGFLQEQAKFDLTVEMLRITFPYLFFISLTAMAGGVLNSYGKFAVPAFTPVFLNLCLIAAALWGAPYFEQPVMALAWAVFVAGIVQLLFQFPFLRRLHLLLRPRFNWSAEGVVRIRKLMLPAIFGSSVVQVNLLFDTLVASFLVTGSVSWLYYSDRLVEFPLGVFGIALATVVLPSLSQRHAEADGAAFGRTIDWALRLVVLIGLPAAAGLFVLSGPMLITMFNYGAFGVDDVAMSRLSLMAYAVGLLGFMLIKVLVTGFYARQDTRTPVKIGVIAMLSNMGLNVLFVVPMVMLALPGPHMGLALATSVSAFLNAGLLYRRLRRDGVYQPLAGWWRWLARVIVATVVMVAALLLLLPAMEVWHGWGVWQRVLTLVGGVLLGGLVYVTVLWLMGMRVAALRLPSGNDGGVN